MLVLSRRRDETIMIGDDIEITIVDIKGDTVRVGISAPKSVSVHRKEIYEAIQAENIAAAQHQLVPDAVAVGGLTALLAKPLAINPDALAAARRLSPGAAGTSGRHPRPGTARPPIEPPRSAAPVPEDPADAVPAPEEPLDPQQPQPGSAPGAAPVTAKSLAAMFKRK